MALPCPDPELMAALVDGRLAAGERERVEGHLADCPECLGDARILLSQRGASLRLRWAAAAVLLLALSLGLVWLWRGWEGTAGPETGPDTPGEVGRFSASWLSPRGDVEAPEDRDFVLGSSALLSLRAGSLAVLDPAGLSVRLERGALHLDTRGDRLAVRAGEVVLEAQDAEFCAGIQAGPPPAFSWMAAAHADEASALGVSVRRGRVSLRVGDLLLELKEGEGGVWKDGRFEREAPSCWEPAPWQHLEAPAALRDSVLDLPVPFSSGGCVVEMLVRRRDPCAELGLRLAAGGRVFEVPVGSSWRGSGWARLRLASGGGRVRASIGAAPLVDGPAAVLGRWPGAAGKAPGIRVWGGDVEIRDLRWRSP